MIILNSKFVMYVLMKDLFGTEITLAQPPLLALAVHGISGSSPDSKKKLKSLRSIWESCIALNIKAQAITEQYQNNHEIFIYFLQFQSFFLLLALRFR